MPRPPRRTARRTTTFGRQHTLLERLDAADLSLAARVMGTEHRWLPQLSQLANHGVLWAGVTAALAVAQQRRPAARGVMALSIASAVVNGPMKGLVQRERPDYELAPLTHRVRRQPITTSWPSGHSASAAAFAAGVAIENPKLGAVIAPLALAVGYSRVYTGVHHPSDVAAGMAAGVGAAYLTTKVWPARPDEPARATSASHAAPALPKGRGLALVVNPHAGSAAHDHVKELLPEATIHLLEQDEDLQQVYDDLAPSHSALGVCGGDGTVAAAATAALRNAMPLVVVPGGTLNHFARDLGVETAEQAAEAAQAGTAVAVDVGTVDGRVFLNNASIGMYADIVHAREKLEKRWGKWFAVVVAMTPLLFRGTPTDIEVDGTPERVWLVFAGNNCYEPPGVAPSHRPALDGETLDVRLVHAESPFSRTRLVLAALSGRSDKTPVHERRFAKTVRWKADGPQKLAMDGEVTDAPADLEVGVEARKLVVYRPA